VGKAKPPLYQQWHQELNSLDHFNGGGQTAQQQIASYFQSLKKTMAAIEGGQELTQQHFDYFNRWAAPASINPLAMAMMAKGLQGAYDDYYDNIISSDKSMNSNDSTPIENLLASIGQKLLATTSTHYKNASPENLDAVPSVLGQKLTEQIASAYGFSVDRVISSYPQTLQQGLGPLALSGLVAHRRRR
jgi:hypothetical protein